MKQQGRAPVEFHVSRKILITVASARKWEQRIEAERAADDAARQKRRERKGGKRDGQRKGG